MSFKTNDVEQLSFFDSFTNLTSREQKALENSWAKVFAEEVFPKIDEKPFAVLYSNKASRPNTPVNVIIGACIIKELFDYSDDEMVEGLMLDLRLQYALHTTSFEEQPLSDKTLSRFRRRCYDYEQTHGVDLYKSAIKSYNKEIAKMMNLDGRIRRMDSMMINSNMRMLARSELIYTSIARLVQYLAANCPEIIPESLKHYAQSNDFNKVFYHERTSTLTERMDQFLTDAETLYDITQSGFEEVPEYELFIRCFAEQSIVEEGKRRWVGKADQLGNSTLLQNPTDPEATFRRKAGKEYRGYVANVEETVGKNGSVVMDYAYEPNIHSDSQFIKDHLEAMQRQDQSTKIITDGAYYSDAAQKLAAEKNVELVPTALTAKKNRRDVSGFKMNEQQTAVLKCPAGHEPQYCCYKQSNDEFKLSFDRNTCASCPHKEECHAKIFKKVAQVLVTKKSLTCISLENKMSGKEYDLYRRIRNGVETIPSILRRKYHLEKLPLGKQRGKFFFGSKIAALNFRKLFCFARGLGSYAPNPLLG